MIEFHYFCLFHQFAPEKIVKKEKEKKGWFSSWFSSDSEDEEVNIEFREESQGDKFKDFMCLF